MVIYVFLFYLVRSTVIFGFVLGPEFQEKMKLEEQLRAAEEMLKYKRKQSEELQLDLQVFLL